MSNLTELRTLHIACDDLPWVDQGQSVSGVQSRVLHAPQDGSFVVTQIRTGTHSVSPLHRHIGPAFAYTTLGSWGHDTSYPYRPGTYVFETPGVAHRFYSGADATTEVIFVSYATLEVLDEDTLEVAGVMSPADVTRQYFEACEAAGLPTPNVLR